MPPPATAGAPGQRPARRAVPQGPPPAGTTPPSARARVELLLHPEGVDRPSVVPPSQIVGKQRDHAPAPPAHRHRLPRLGLRIGIRPRGRQRDVEPNRVDHAQQRQPRPHLLRRRLIQPRQPPPRSQPRTRLLILSDGSGPRSAAPSSTPSWPRTHVGGTSERRRLHHDAAGSTCAAAGLPLDSKAESHLEQTPATLDRRQFPPRGGVRQDPVPIAAEQAPIRPVSRSASRRTTVRARPPSPRRRATLF
jgi:hypothetical protein